MKSPSVIPNQSCEHPIRCSSAFTLIELLTVIAIIGILAAIIIPTVGKVRQSARTSVCVSNLRQIGAGLFAYASDNRDSLPVQYWHNSNSAPPALRLSNGKTEVNAAANGLGFLAGFGYLGGNGGITALSGYPGGKPEVLHCPSDNQGYFWNKSGAGSWCSYVYQSPHPISKTDGATDTSKSNKVSDLVSQMAVTTDAMQIYSNRPAVHGTKIPVLYGGGQVQLREWRGNGNMSIDSKVHDFDLAEDIRGF